MHNWLLSKNDPSFIVNEPQKNQPQVEIDPFFFQGALQPLADADENDINPSAELMKKDLTFWVNNEGWRSWQINKI